LSNEPFTHELVRFDLRRRGFPDPLLVVSDGAPGVIRAIEECFPRSARQRRLAHKLRNLQSKVPEGSVAGVQGAEASCYQAASPALARLLRDDIVATYGAALPSPLACLTADDPRQRCPDISLAKKLLTWEPRIQLQDGLVKTIDYFGRAELSPKRRTRGSQKPGC
jgi:mutator family transposase